MVLVVDHVLVKEVDNVALCVVDAVVSSADGRGGGLEDTDTEMVEDTADMYVVGGEFVRCGNIQVVIAEALADADVWCRLYLRKQECLAGKQARKVLVAINSNFKKRLLFSLFKP